MKKRMRNGKSLPFFNIFLPVVIKEETTPEEMAKQINHELELIKAEGFTPEREASLKKVLEEGAVEKMNAAVEKVKAELQLEAKTKADELEGIIAKQGEEIAKMTSTGEGSAVAEAKAFMDQIQAIHKNVEKPENQSAVTIKAAEYPDNAILVNTHNAIAGAIGAVGTYFAQFIPGIARKPVPKSTIMDEVTVVPLNADRLVSISQTETVSIAITLEGAIKPVSTVVWAAFDVAAEAVASIFKTSTKMRRFFKTFVQLFVNTLQDYFDKIIPQLVIAQIRLYAVPFTAVPAQQTHAAPNNWDAIVAVIASLVKKGYAPNSARMSIFAWEAMMTMKASDGHYMLQNNGSINLLEKTITFGDVVVNIHPDVEFGDDELFVGDLRNVFVGVDANTDYTEFYDAEDGKRNLLSHRLEKFIAVNIPVANRAGLVIDTFTNIKASITEV